MKKILLILLLCAVLAISGCSPKEEQPQTPDEQPEVDETPQNEAEVPEEEPVVPASLNTRFIDPIPNVGEATIVGDDNMVTITFRNNRDSDITLTLLGKYASYSAIKCIEPTMRGYYKNEPVEALKTVIKKGDTFTVSWDCPESSEPGTDFSADLIFSYRLETNGRIYQATGTVKGKYS